MLVSFEHTTEKDVAPRLSMVYAGEARVAGHSIMATKRLTPAMLEGARQVVAALQTLPSFTGAASHSPQAMQALAAEVDAKRARETQAQNALDAARDDAAATEQELYNRSLRVKELVIGQFGSDSDEAAAVGLKKKSERKAPTRKKSEPKTS